MAQRERTSTIGWILGLIVILAILSIISIFVYNLIASGKGGVYFKEAWVNVEPGAEAAKGGLFSFWEYITNPAAANRDFDSVVEENAENPNLGIKITEFEAVSPSYDENKPIQLFARFEMASLSGKDIQEQVILGCNLEDYRSSSSVEPNILTYYGDGSLYVDSALCKFPRGISVDRTVGSKISKINATSDYTQLVTYRAYFMRADKYNNLRLAGEDPFQYYDINYPLLLPGNEIRSIVTDGPLNIGIGVSRSQPFTEGSEFIPVVVSFSNRYTTGRLVEIKDFKLILSNLIELDNDPNLCDFAFIEAQDDYNVYGLTEYAKQRKLIGKDRFDDVSFSCSFKVSNDFPADFSDIFYTVFRLEAKYSYVVEKKTTVEVRNVEDIGEDACNFIASYDECFEARGCRPQTIGGEFSNCTRCVYSNCADEYGSNSDNCENDPCQFGNCVYDGQSCKVESTNLPD